MTNLLAIETSGEACSVALCVDGEIRQREEAAPMQHAELLLPAVQSLLMDAAVPLSKLDAIAFGRGPGSFTSLRIGIGVVQGLAWGANLPVVPVSSLAAAAQEAVEKQAAGNASICVALDARMQEVYFCEFRSDEDGIVRAAGAERVCPPDAVVIDTDRPFVAVGNGFDRFEALRILGEQSAVCLPGIRPTAAAPA